MTEIPYSARTRHVYICGKSGYGKSTLEYWMALQDMAQGKSVFVVDPNGDLVEQLLNYIPRHRVEDTIYLDGLSPVPLDFMAWQDDHDRAILADDLMVMFRRLSEGEWGPRMDAIMNYAILTILEAHRPFLDIYRVLTSQPYRERSIMPAIQNKPVLSSYWANEYPRLPHDAYAPITARMAKFLLTPALETALGHPNPELKIPKVIERNQILLVNLNKIGEKAGNIYGSLIVSQIQQAVFRRGSVPMDRRTPVYVYVDEFQDFSTSSFGKILSQARKFNLGLTLANQHPKQIPDLIDDVKGCVSTFVMFQMDSEHARSLASAIRPYKPEDIERLPRFRALYRPASGEPKFITIPLPPGKPTENQYRNAESIRKRTIESYSCKPAPESVESKGDDIRSSSAATIPPHPRKKPRP
jgi:hypothetical protein